MADAIAAQADPTAADHVASVVERLRACLILPRPRPERAHRVHIVGIGGSGMSAIALILATMGHDVSGTDVVETAVVPHLRMAGIHVEVVAATALFTAALPQRPDVIAHSTAFPPAATDLHATAGQGVDVLARRRDPRPHLRQPSHDGRVGHAWQDDNLVDACPGAGRGGAAPSFMVGGELRDIGEGAVWNDGEWFVVEADESDGTFVELGAEIAVVTNVEADHLDHYGSLTPDRGGFRSIPR